MIPLKNVGKTLNFVGAKSKKEKGIKNLSFSKLSSPKSSFFNIFKEFLQKSTPRTLFDSQHSIYDEQIFHMVFRGVPKIFLKIQ